MPEQQLTQFYDKLLHYLNRTYATNIRTQELYLDLRKHTRKLRFNSIKNIYHTLTEGKADEVIYSKQKPSLIKNSSFNQKFTERTCWRLIEKLINKIAYYLMNEKKLDCIAPSILKALHFTRNAPERVTHKAAFVQFFSEVIDTLIAENNLLEQKIYELLIQRGYIYSIDEFYRMSRFEGPDADFTYTNPEGEEENDFYFNTELSTPAQLEPIKLKEKAELSKSKKRMVSIKKFVHTRNKSRFQSFNLKIDDDYGLPKIDQNIEEAESETGSDQESGSQLQDNLKYNKIVHNIHNQVEKIVDQIMNHKDFQKMLAGSEHLGNNLFKNDDKSVPKEPILKQVLKNLKIKNFKANEKLITMNQNNGEKLERERKNSKPKERKEVKFGPRGLKTFKNEKKRASIATALSSRLREKVLMNSGIQQIKQLIVRNLGNLQNKCDENQDTQKANIRKKKRLQTQTFEANFQSNKDFKRRSSNLNFLRNAFIFNSDSKTKINYQEQKNAKYADLLNQSSASSENGESTLKTIESHKTKNMHPPIKTSPKKDKHSLFTNEKIAKMSTSNRCGHIIDRKDFRRQRRNNFNTNLLQLAAKKYHRYQTEQSKRKNFQDLFYNFEAQVSLKNLKTLHQLQKNNLRKQANMYMHHRKYETYDRLLRRVF